jgi:hypothetical protein
MHFVQRTRDNCQLLAYMPVVFLSKTIRLVQPIFRKIPLGFERFPKSCYSYEAQVFGDGEYARCMVWRTGATAPWWWCYQALLPLAGVSGTNLRLDYTFSRFWCRFCSMPDGRVFVDFRRLNVRSKFTSVTFDFVSTVISSLHRLLWSLATLVVMLTLLNYCSVVLHSVTKAMRVST